MDRSKQVSGVGMLSIGLALAGMLVAVSQTDGWKLRTSADAAKSTLISNKTVISRPAS